MQELKGIVIKILVVLISSLEIQWGWEGEGWYGTRLCLGVGLGCRQ